VCSLLIKYDFYNIIFIRFMFTWPYIKFGYSCVDVAFVLGWWALNCGGYRISDIHHSSVLTTFGTLWGWYKCIETRKSDYNINTVKIKKYILCIIGWNKNCIQYARYIHKKLDIDIIYMPVRLFPVYFALRGMTP